MADCPLVAAIYKSCKDRCCQKLLKIDDETVIFSFLLVLVDVMRGVQKGRWCRLVAQTSFSFATDQVGSLSCLFWTSVSTRDPGGSMFYLRPVLVLGLTMLALSQIFVCSSFQSSVLLSETTHIIWLSENLFSIYILYMFFLFCLWVLEKGRYCY